MSGTSCLCPRFGRVGYGFEDQNVSRSAGLQRVGKLRQAIDEAPLRCVRFAPLAWAGNMRTWGATGEYPRGYSHANLGV